MKRTAWHVVLALFAVLGVITAGPASASTGSCGSGYVSEVTGYETYGSQTWGTSTLYYKASTNDLCVITQKTWPSLVGVSTYVKAAVVNSSGTEVAWSVGNFLYFAVIHYTPPASRCFTPSGVIKDIPGHTTSFGVIGDFCT